MKEGETGEKEEMLSRITMALLVLAAVVVCSTTLAVESSPVGVKATTEEPKPGSEVAVPATSEWGMLIMVLLVMTASTAAMLGGGLPGRMLPLRPTPPSPGEAPRSKRRSAKLPSSPKNKSKRPFSHQRASRAQARHDAAQSARQKNLSRSRRRREGPGCRGIR